MVTYPKPLLPAFGLARVFAMCCLLGIVVHTSRAKAQAAIPDEPLISSADPASLMSREEWRDHVGAIKQRIRNSAAIHLKRSRQIVKPTPDELSREATRRVLSDYSLAPGDLVMTDRGLLVFKGRTGEEPNEADFEKTSAAIERRRNIR
jgi:hypothetical protein